MDLNKEKKENKMSIQIGISDRKDSNGIMLKCVTVTLKKPEIITTFSRNFHIYIEKNHLFIVDNEWNALHTKTYSYAKEKADLEKTREEALAKKPRELDGICIDLCNIKMSRNLKKRKPKE